MEQTNFKGDYGYAPLHIAARLGNVRVLRELLTYDDLANANKRGCLAVHIAARAGHLEVREILYRHDNRSFQGRSHTTGGSVLHFAVAHRQKDVLNYLMNSTRSGSIDVDAVDLAGLTAAHLAAKEGYVEGLRIFSNAMQHRLLSITTRYKLQTPLHIGIMEARLEAAEFLLGLSNITDMIVGNKFGDGPVHIAAILGHIHLLEHMLSKHNSATLCRIPSAGQSGLTILHYAIQYKHDDVAKMIIAKCFVKKEMGGAFTDFDYKENMRILRESQSTDTPLHHAIRYGRTDILGALLELPINLNLPNGNGYTPLHIAVHERNKHAVIQLVNAGADASILVKGFHSTRTGHHKEV